MENKMNKSTTVKNNNINSIENSKKNGNNRQNKVLFELSKRIYITPSVYENVMSIIEGKFEKIKKENPNLKSLNIFSSFDLLQCFLLTITKYGKNPIVPNELYQLLNTFNVPSPTPYAGNVEKKRLFINHYSHEFVTKLLSKLEQIENSTNVEKLRFSRPKVEISDYLFNCAVKAVENNFLTEEDIYNYLQRKCEYQKECLSEEVLKRSGFILKANHLSA